MSSQKRTAEELKAAIFAQGYTLKAFAEKIEVACGTLRHVLSGHQSLTPALRNHIEMALQLDRHTAPAPAAASGSETPGGRREGLVIYKIEIPDGKLDELCAGLTSPADRAAALERIVHHNLRELVELGQTCEWTDEERKILQSGLDSTPSM